MSLAQHGRHFCQARVCLPLKPERQELRAKTHVSHPGHRPWLEDWPGWPVAMCLINSNWLCVEQSLSKESQRFAKLREKQKEHYARDIQYHSAFPLPWPEHCSSNSTSYLIIIIIIIIITRSKPKPYTRTLGILLLLRLIELFKNLKSTFTLSYLSVC